jgi:hypothetical protein
VLVLVIRFAPRGIVGALADIYARVTRRFAASPKPAAEAAHG